MSCQIINNNNQSLFVFFVSGCKDCQYCSIRSVPLTVIKFLIIFMSFEFLITKFVQSCSARTGFTPMHDAFVCSHCCKRSSRSGLCMSSLSPLHRLATQHFDECYKRKQSESFFEPARTHHLGLKAQKFENSIYKFGCVSLKVLYNSCKLQRILQVAKFLFMYSFIHINILFFSGTYLLKLSSF